MLKIIFIILLISSVLTVKYMEDNVNFNLNDCANMTIGIVGNPNPYLDEDFTQIKYDKNYINWINERGGIAVPISTFMSNEELDLTLSKLNGVLLPGGSVNLKPTGKFEDFIMKVINKVMKQNENGNGIALWGTCQGLEVINLLLSGAKTRDEFFQRVYGMGNTTLSSIPYIPNSNRWQLGAYLQQKNLLKTYTQEKVNCHLHDWSIPLSKFDQGSQLGRYMYITSTQKDIRGNTYVDAFESYAPYNIHGVQFHPDTLTDPTFYFNTFGKQNWEKAVPVSQAMADFFIERCRASNYCMVQDLNKLKNFEDYQSSDVCNESYFFYENDINHKGDAFKCIIVHNLNGKSISKSLK